MPTRGQKTPMPVRNRRPSHQHIDGELSIEGVQKKVKDRFKRGSFDKELFKLADELYRLTRVGDLQNRYVLESRCLITEVNEHRGALDIARKAVSEGERIFEIIRKYRGTSNIVDSRLAREQVRF